MVRKRTTPYNPYKARCDVKKLLNLPIGRPKKWQSLLLDYYKFKTEKEGLHGDYLYEQSRFIKQAFEYWGDVEVQKITADMLIDYLSTIPSERKRNDTRIALKGFLTRNDNFTIMKLPKMKKIKRKRRSKKVKWLTDSQYKVLLTWNVDPREALIIHLGVNLGMRRCGMVNLKLEDIHDDYLTVYEKGGERDISFQTSSRILRLDTKSIMENYLVFRKQMLKGKESPWLIVGPRSPYFSEEMAKKLISSLRNRIGFHFTYHDMRRTWGRWAFRSGTPIEVIADILGHEDTVTTMLYLGLNFDDQKDTMNKIRKLQEEKLFK